jgi:hypothetical protein
MEKESGKRYHILPVMLNNRYKRSAVTGAEICLIEFRYHLPGNILVTVDTQDLFLEGGKAQ